MADCSCNHFASSLGNVTFDAGVSVGIGTLPSYTLEVQGEDAAGSGVLVTTAGYTNLPATVGVTNGVILNARGLNVVDDFVTLTAGPSAGVGIAVSRPGAALGVRNSTGYAAIFEAGNVGIGTTSPGYPLDVAGTVRMTGVLLGGDQLMSGALKDSTGTRVNVDASGCYYAD